MGTSTEQVIHTTCYSHCGGACPVAVRVRDGRIVRIDSTGAGAPLSLPCAKMRAYRQRVYHPDRLLYPLRRAGERGSGQFTRISWDEALDRVASELKRVKMDYGNAAIMFLCSSGDITWLHNAGLTDRLLNRFGGYTGAWGEASAEGNRFATMATYGTPFTGNTRDDLLNSKLIIMWGWNPAVGIRYGNESEYLARARARGTPVICIDPRFSDSAAVFAGRWIPIRPNTDTALLAALAHVMLRENLQDQAFLDRCTLGFERYRAYLLGEEDGVPKTPGWAEAITGVPVEITTALAREYASAKPAALLDGFAPGRTAYGEQFHRSIMTLACMGGNVGVSGGYAGAAAFGGGHLRLGGLGPKLSDRLRPASNPVDAARPARPKSAFYQGAAKQPTSDWYLGGPSSARISRFFFADAILKGRAGGYPADYRLLYTVNVNYLNQYANSNKIARALRALEFFVTQEQFMTATARFADIILPTSTFLERNDITKGIEYYGLVNKAIEPPGECRSHLEIAGGLARRLGIEDFAEKTEEGWVREIAGGIEGADFTQFKRDAVHPVDRQQPYVSFRDQARDPARHPFATPSGKIEIYSQTIADMNDPLLPPVPKYIEAWEGRCDPLAARYPLQLVTTHTLRRAHTQNETVPWLRELYPQAITLHAADAAARGIRDGDRVRVFNDRGVMEIPARVTERILPGVVDLPQGAWYAPDERGVDRGGCANVLTRDTISPGGAFCSNTCLVQVEKA